MQLDPFALLFAGHLAGDYLFQTDRMVELKARQSLAGWLANITHVGCHIAATLALLLAARVVGGLDFSAVGAVAALLWTGATHGLIDRRWPIELWMNHTGSSGFFRKDGAPLVDQAAHIVVGIIPATLLIAALS